MAGLLSIDRSLEDFTNDGAWGCRAHHFTGPTVGSLKSIL